MADEHNTLPKSTRRHVKLDKFVFGTTYYVNTGLRHQYGISAAESQTFLRAKRPQRRRARRNGCFRRLGLVWEMEAPFDRLLTKFIFRMNFTFPVMGGLETGLLILFSEHSGSNLA